MSEHHWWNCGRVVYVADTEDGRVDQRRVRSPGRSLCKFGLDTLRIGMRGEIFDGKVGPGPNVFPTMTHAAAYMAGHHVDKAKMAISVEWERWHTNLANHWKAVAVRWSLRDGKVTP